MKVAFVSNFFNHHQEFLSNALHSATDGEYRFIATEPVPEERLKLGYENANYKYDYIICTYENEQKLASAKKIIDEADVVIYGAAPFEYIKKRLKEKKITFWYSERINRTKMTLYKQIKRSVGYWFLFGRYSSFYLLCTSAFASMDYAKTGTFLNRAYKWAYFTEVKNYDINKLILEKKENSILWVARMLELKHPEAPILALQKLKEKGYKFHLNMIGIGEKENEIKQLIKKCNMEDCVCMLGSMSPQEVRKYMEESEMFLFTSDKQEGWGAVLNEAMNSGCAVVASHAIGSVPFLIEDKENGMIYKDGEIDELCQKIKILFDNKEQRKTMGIKAYHTMLNEWNAENAAKKLIALSKEILQKRKKFFDSGVCSKAPLLKDDWYLKRK